LSSKEAHFGRPSIVRSRDPKIAVHCAVSKLLAGCDDANETMAMSVLGQKQTSGRRCPMSALTWWSLPVDATLYLQGEMECAAMGQRFHRGFTAAKKTE